MTQLLTTVCQEIERLYDGEAPKHDQQCDFEDGYFTGIATIEKFLDTLEQQEPEGLDEAARLYAIPYYMKDVDKEHLDEYPYDSGLEAAFKAGAEWAFGQGYSFTSPVYANEMGQTYITFKFVFVDNEVKEDDTVTVQIRKK